MTTANVYKLLLDGFPADRNQRLFLTTDGNGATYGDIENEVDRFVYALNVHGIAPGDRVAVQLNKSISTISLYLACLRLGAVYVPLNTAYSNEELAYLIDDAQPALLVREPSSEHNTSNKLTATTKLVSLGKNKMTN